MKQNTMFAVCNRPVAQSYDSYPSVFETEFRSLCWENPMQKRPSIIYAQNVKDFKAQRGFKTNIPQQKGETLPQTQLNLTTTIL